MSFGAMDAFAELGLERRLGLTAEEVAAAFREAGKEAHPDAGGERSRFERLEEARRILSLPDRRLRHWLELEGVEGSARGAVSGPMMEVFGEVGSIFQAVDELLRQRDAAATALGKALLEPRAQAERENLEALQERLEALVDERVARFPEVERRERDGWELARELGFLVKWQAQARERYGRLF